MRKKLERELEAGLKVDVSVVPGTHESAAEVTKQICDKERCAGAMENPALRDMIHGLIVDVDSH